MPTPDVAIAMENGGLAIRFTKSPSLVGDLVHWQHDTFLARWREHGLPGRSFPQPGRDHFTAIADLAEREGALTREIVGLVEGRDR